MNFFSFGKKYNELESEPSSPRSPTDNKPQSPEAKKATIKPSDSDGITSEKASNDDKAKDSPQTKTAKPVASSKKKSYFPSFGRPKF
mmetsp:Transcript_1067/g.2016  ORF Transcript_1067/g.2016 Transcript_1067/m.2016 type:complete len:87 (+) Transcript_1067:109-369(+)|eukprot:CAMPEP_0170168060 /NCGR_PEP_ID=MMETSP0040_2-20121228/1251_1 /TAXON_ID=641309 /ORGANISM="Lotharella oceanica, Strain CCMP622" /LENGTH=86 /DNA_ID=CAMNT_0010406235 /DNA_START=84 /DNA_END=344 /DNA_ORIENTATION=+